MLLVISFIKIGGSIFLTFHLFMSYVILLNMLIAVLSKIYEGLYENSKMLFQQEIITRKNQLMDGIQMLFLHWIIGMKHFKDKVLFISLY